jgi:hypothetical protein
MAELTNLETKLGEVIGLAMAAQATVDRVEKLNKDREIARQLKTMRAEAKAAEKEGTEVAGTFDGKKSKILTEARSVKKKGGEMMKAYLERGSDALDGFEFMTMAEAGEVGHWQVLDQMAKQTGNAEVRRLVRTHLPIQKRHLKEAMTASMTLAAKEDPNASA